VSSRVATLAQAWKITGHPRLTLTITGVLPAGSNSTTV
jgi:hypothetical protein